MKNNKGMSSVELMTMLGFVIAAFAIISGIFFNSYSKQKYSIFVKNAGSLAATMSQYRDTHPGLGDVVYLKDAIDDLAIDEIPNPFPKGKYCDEYETKLEITNGTKYLTFKCGDYVIYKHRPGSGIYQIYKVGPWVDVLPSGETESSFAYNYYDENGKLVLDEYLPVGKFIEKYNKTEGTNIRTVNSARNIATKVIYRSRVLVKEIS